MRQRPSIVVAGILSLALLAPANRAAAQSKDKAFLKDGQVLTGDLTNPTFTFVTIYGRVEIPNAACERIERDADNVERLHTVNREVITGYVLRNPALRIAGGPMIEVQKELLTKLVFAPRKRHDLTPLDYFQMKNGDVFYGSVEETAFTFVTSYGTLNTAFSTVLKLEDVNGQTRMYLADGNTVMGYITTDSFTVKTAYAFTLRIPKSSIKLVQMRPPG